MNNRITQEINSAFIATGCIRMLSEESDAHYYHPKTGLYICYPINFNEHRFQRYSNNTEVVVVVNNDAELREVRNLPLPCEVVNLQELAQFLSYRATSAECSAHRAAKERYEYSEDVFDDAEGTYKGAQRRHARAVERFNLANANFALANKEFLKANAANAEAIAEFWAAPTPPSYHPTLA